MIKNHSINALAIASVDHLMSDVNQLKDFVDELAEAKVELIIADGSH